LGVTSAVRDRLLEQMHWGRGDDDFSAVARKYLPEIESPAYEETQLQEQEEQASPEGIAPVPEAAPALAEMSSPRSDVAATVASAGSGEVKQTIPWRRGFLTQLLRRGRQLLKQPVSSKEG
jgi:beta-phosphoglucomutase-like phosphatase (HAD superfamily)